ncbi:MAG TPA: type II secretion system F family protein [Methanoregulaceae archaeon]|nr:type II secretion system F family protein [Methanoregulaceae archaeon]HPD11360.1 type II secretion system F family protein [Methanoregulaceae archaeon]
MTFKDLFTAKKETTGETTQPQTSPHEDQQGRTKVLSNILRRDKPPAIDLEEREKSEFEHEQDVIVQKIEKYRASEHGFGRLLKHPIKVLTEQPINTLYVTIPAAILFFLVGTALVIHENGVSGIYTSTAVDDILVFSFFIAAVPLAILDFREMSRRRHIEEALPNFYRDLAGMNDSGMTLPNAVHLVAQSDYSTLTPYVKRLDNEMSWNVTFIDAIQRFRVRLATPLTDRSIDLIAKASKAGGDVSEVLRAAANDSYEYITLRTDRRNNMLIYIVIVFIAFMVFVFVIYILVTTFLSVMSTAGSAAAATSAAASSFGANVDLPLYTRIFTHAAILQGLFSGFVAGQMGEGRAVAGLKYSLIMVLIAWVMFRFFI